MALSTFDTWFVSNKLTIHTTTLQSFYIEIQYCKSSHSLVPLFSLKLVLHFSPSQTHLFQYLSIAPLINLLTDMLSPFSNPKVKLSGYYPHKSQLSQLLEDLKTHERPHLVIEIEIGEYRIYQCKPAKNLITDFLALCHNKPEQELASDRHVAP